MHRKMVIPGAVIKSLLVRELCSPIMLLAPSAAKPTRLSSSPAPYVLSKKFLKKSKTIYFWKGYCLRIQKTNVCICTDVCGGHIGWPPKNLIFCNINNIVEGTGNFINMFDVKSNSTSFLFLALFS